MGLREWLHREKFDLPPEEDIIHLIDEIRDRLKTAKGSERTKLTYMLANNMVFLNQILDKKKPKKPVRLNSRGKWVWVADDE